MNAQALIDRTETRSPFGYPCLYSNAVAAEVKRREARDSLPFVPTMEDLAETFTIEDHLEALGYADEALALAVATGDVAMVGKVVMAARKAQIERLYRFAHYEGLDAPDIGEEALKAISPALRAVA